MFIKTLDYSLIDEGINEKMKKNQRKDNISIKELYERIITFMQTFEKKMFDFLISLDL